MPLRWLTYCLGIALGCLLCNCAERYYLPTVTNPIALERSGEILLSGAAALLGPLPVNGVDAQIAYSPLPHLGIGVSGTYYHPFDDRRWKAAGDLVLGGYGRLSDDVQWSIYALAGRFYAHYHPELLRSFFTFGFDDGAGPQGAEEGYVDLTLNRYAIWPSIRITDQANMSWQVGTRLGVIGLERLELMGPLRADEVALHQRFGRDTPFLYADLYSSFKLNRRGPHQFVATAILTTSRDGFPTESLSITVGYIYRLGMQEAERAATTRRQANRRRKRLE